MAYRELGGGGGGYEPNPALRVLNRWFFDKIQVQDAWVQDVRELLAPGAWPVTTRGQ